MARDTITINGKAYDSTTGMPIDVVVSSSAQTQEPAPTHGTGHHAGALHATTKKSETLNRQFVSKQTPSKPIARAAKPHQVVVRSPQISKFAPHPVVSAQSIHSTGRPTGRHMDIAPTQHPVAARAISRQASVRQAASAPVAPPKPSQVIKQEAIAEAMKQAPTRKEATKKQKIKAKQTKKAPSRARFFSFAGAGLALMLLAGYFTYINMPNLSVRVAASQAGINASYPAYRPDGYSLHGPVGYTDGQVTMQFAANAGPQNFTLTQTKSTWDSSALLENYVQQKAGQNYLTYNQNGLTIYTYGSNAAWVNGGILYTITGDAPLSGTQLRNIATSV